MQIFEGGMRLAWYKLPEELLQMRLPYSAVILAVILYDADRKNTQHIIIKQRDIAKQMQSNVNTVLRGIRHLENAGIILSHKSIGDATEIALKEGVVPPRKERGSDHKKQRPEVRESGSFDAADLEKLVNNF